MYVDTSAVGRVLLGEPDAPAVLRDLAGFDQHVASRLLRIELRRLALREDALEAADRLLDGVATVAKPDAMDLATAVRLATAGVLDTVMTYDRRLADGAAHHGLRILAPV